MNIKKVDDKPMAIHTKEKPKTESPCNAVTINKAEADMSVLQLVKKEATLFVP